MVHGVNPLFLCLCDLKGIIHIMPVLRRGAAGLVVGKTVHFLCSAGRALVDGIIVVGCRRLFCRLFRGFPLWLLLGFLRLLRLWCCRGLIALSLIHISIELAGIHYKQAITACNRWMVDLSLIHIL